MSKNGQGAWNRADLLKEMAAKRVERMEVQGRPFWVRSLSLTELLSKGSELSSEANIISTFIACVCDQDGTALFVEEDRDSIKATFPAGTIMRVFNTAWKLSGFDQGELAILGKDSEAITSGALPLDSPSPSTARSRN